MACEHAVSGVKNISTRTNENVERALVPTR